MTQPSPLPSPGRVVHYYLAMHDVAEDSRPRVALITQVRTDTVDLHVFIEDKDQPVAFVQWVPFASEPMPGCWSWPPRV